MVCKTPTYAAASILVFRSNLRRMLSMSDLEPPLIPAQGLEVDARSEGLHSSYDRDTLPDALNQDPYAVNFEPGGTRTAYTAPPQAWWQKRVGAPQPRTVHPLVLPLPPTRPSPTFSTLRNPILRPRSMEVYVNQFEGCLYACASYNLGQQNSTCVAVVYDTSVLRNEAIFSGGNCFLKANSGEYGTVKNLTMLVF